MARKKSRSMESADPDSSPVTPKESKKVEAPQPDPTQPDPTQPSEESESDDKVAKGLNIVGIGASAGGVEALRTFFEAAPANAGLTFVVVIHLSPEHASNLSEVLQSATKLPVQQITSEVEMKADHVYVIPPNKNLSIVDGRLSLSEFEEPRGHRSPIDHFFRTLAQVHPDSMAILLSGGGTDGTVGMKAVKERGGVLLAQSPDEARFDSMPRSAIATGLVDFVLPAAELARKVVELSYQGSRRSAVLPAAEMAVVQNILMHLHARTGSDFSSYKRNTVMRRITRRMRVNGIEDLTAYYRFLRSNVNEADDLLKDLLISVTSFFRDEEKFQALEEHVFPRILANKTSEEEVRIWVPGCATGEEAYSLAMLILEWMARAGANPRIQIFASDLDDRALGFAREGLYPDAIGADVSDERLQRFFTREGNYYRIKPEVRDIVLFAPHNLLRDPPFSRLHLVSCRNLLMYLERDMQEKVFEVFHYALLPDGFLFLGTAENADIKSDLFAPVDKVSRIYRRASSIAQVPRHLPDLPLRVVFHEPMPVRRPRIESLQDSISDAQRHREALEAYAPPSILVDERYNIVHVSSSASRYLHFPAGSPTSNLLKVVREELRSELRSALYQALSKGSSTNCSPVALQVDGQARNVQIFIKPARQSDGPPLALLFFAETAAPAAEAGRKRGDKAETRLHQLEEELEATRDQLNATIGESETQQEELKAANEELLSINEEYKSTLEELETSKEELQSINEELHTVNEELRGKVDELSHANGDLKNFMQATEVASVFLDRDLRIKSYTPALADIVNVTGSDLGRPLSHLTHRLQYQDLTSDARRVMDTSEPLGREVRRDDGRVYFVRLAPYVTIDGRLDGAVFTAVDLTPLKTAEERLRQSEERYRLLVRGVKEYAIFTTNLQGSIDLWNSGAERLFGYNEREIANQSLAVIYTADDREAHVPEIELETARKNGTAPDERWHLRKDGSRFWGTGSVSLLFDETGVPGGFAKILRDNTLQLKAAEELRESREKLAELNLDLEQRIQDRTSELRTAHERVRRLASDLVMSEQRERHRLALLLHDELQQQLYGIQIKLSIARQGIAHGEIEQSREQIADASSHLSNAIEQTRRLTFDLSPPVLREEGLEDALQWLARHMNTLHGLNIQMNIQPFEKTVSDEKRILLFHATRELLFNVVKHSETNEADVELWEVDESVAVRVRDGGVGFVEEEQNGNRPKSGGFGLNHMRERLDLVGGTLEIESGKGEGTAVTVKVPLKDRRD